MTTITVTTWGRKGSAKQIGETMQVRVGPEETRIEAARRSIARRTGLHVCGCRPDGFGMGPKTAHYELTLGAPHRHGGYSVEGSLWLAIPVEG